jgi:hypothetical protein
VDANFREKIRDYTRAFLYNVLGKKPQTKTEKEEYKRLLEAGLIKKASEDNIGFLFGLGKAAAILGDAIVKDWGKAEIKKFITSSVGQFTRIETESIELIRAEMEDRVESLFKDVGVELQTNYKNRILGGDEFNKQVREALIDRTVKRKTIDQLRSDIGHRTGAWGRDLYRIAMTETYNLYQLGTAIGYIKATGKNPQAIMVAKIPRGRGISCKECLKLYLKPGSDEPKLFKLSEIMGASNVGRKRKDWVPTLTATHPFCQERLSIVYPGEIWNSEKRRFQYFPKK